MLDDQNLFIESNVANRSSRHVQYLFRWLFLKTSDAIETFCHHKFPKTNEDSLNEQDDYGVPFSKQQYMHWSCYISLFKYESFDQSDPPESPQILDTYSIVVL